jgi:ParB/RepB/Spo0J family partition protein
VTLDLSFKDLADVAEKGSGGAGSPLRIAIDRIDEDPDQPRRVFSEQELDELSATIREHGVLQPILVRRSNREGRYVIVMGARRYRAAQRAGLREIPAFLQESGEPDRYAQMIENIQRDDLRAPEIAAFVAGRLDAGDTQAEISRKLGKPRDWVSRFASVQSMPEFLRARLESSSIRALYEIYQAWRTHPAAIERLCAARESFTDAQARELVRQVRADSDRTDAQSEPPAGSVPLERSDLATRASLWRAASEPSYARGWDHRCSILSKSMPRFALSSASSTGSVATSTRSRGPPTPACCRVGRLNLISPQSAMQDPRSIWRSRNCVAHSLATPIIGRHDDDPPSRAAAG